MDALQPPTKGSTNNRGGTNKNEGEKNPDSYPTHKLKTEPQRLRDGGCRKNEMKWQPKERSPGTDDPSAVTPNPIVSLENRGKKAQRRNNPPPIRSLKKKKKILTQNEERRKKKKRRILQPAASQHICPRRKFIQKFS